MKRTSQMRRVSVPTTMPDQREGWPYVKQKYPAQNCRLVIGWLWKMERERTSLKLQIADRGLRILEAAGAERQLVTANQSASAGERVLDPRSAIRNPRLKRV